MRINEIAKLIKRNSVVIDVGSDHAQLAISLLKDKKAKFVYNIEINEKPLENTINNLKEAKVIEQTKNILNDGLKGLDLKVFIHYCVISGMGGNNIIKILKSKPEKLCIDQFILLPNNNEQALRKFLKENNYYVMFEKIVHENQFYYQLIQVCKDDEKGLEIETEEDTYFGPYNLKHPTNTFREYLHLKYQELASSNAVKFNYDKRMEMIIIEKYLKKSI